MHNGIHLLLRDEQNLFRRIEITFHLDSKCIHSPGKTIMDRRKVVCQHRQRTQTQDAKYKDQDVLSTHAGDYNAYTLPDASAALTACKLSELDCEPDV